MNEDKKKEEMTKVPELNKMIEEAKVDRAEEYKQFSKELQQALYYFTNENPFIGGLLQEMNFKPDYRLPTAALSYDKKRQSFEILVNPKFFHGMSLDHRIGVLHHEVLHFTNAHVFRFGMDGTNKNKEEHKKRNIACDMAINQFIRTLPDGCVDVQYFETDDGQPFPKFATAEVYLELLKDNPNAMKKAGENMEKAGVKKPGTGEAFGDGDGQTLDQHDWDALSDDEKKQMAEEMRKMIKRTMEKTSYDKSSLPDAIKDLIEEMTTFLNKMNYKQILMSAIKKSVSFTDRAATWKRPNKRYGTVAKGTTLAKLPTLWELVDTSGSISVKELNEFLTVVDGFLKAGSRKCMIGFWHTSMYKLKKYKLGQKITQEEIESGGTDMTDTVEKVNKGQPDLAIILTDGYYSSNVDPEVQMVVVISENGTMDHPLKNHPMVKTISMKGLK